MIEIRIARTNERESMSGRKRYHRISVTRPDGSKIKYDADAVIEADPSTGVITYTVKSQVLPDKAFVFRGTGNSAEDLIYFERKCQEMYFFDDGFRVRAWPKPERTSAPAVAVAARCDKCGDTGWVEDDTGYPETCECRGG